MSHPFPPLPGKNDTQSIRPFLRTLDAGGQLLVARESVDPVHELAARLSVADGEAAVIFADVAGSSLPVVGNLLSSRERIGQAIGVEATGLTDALLDAIARPVAPVQADTAPVQAVVERAAPLAGLPVPTFFAREGRPYITAGVIVARDPRTGSGNASFARIGILDEHRGMIGIAPNHHLAQFARAAAALGQTLDIAVVLGAHPAIQLAACLYLGLGEDEMECAGRFLGEPVRTVRAKTVDLDVPAEAEIVLEGRIDPTDMIDEGLISEYHGMYENYGAGLGVDFTCMTRREDALFQAILPGFHKEHIYLGAVPIAASLRAAIGRVIPNVGDVAVTEAGGGRTDIVIQIDQPKPGQARRAMFAAWGSVSIVKRITIVDADIDPWDVQQVEWARLSRMRNERDIVIVPGVGADRSEPMEADGMVAKMGFDATMKVGDRGPGMERALPPAVDMERARAWMRALRHTV
ncbi:MAG TPA: UbiD family decarboxylase [Novosphingobium sp.]|nr:UbiD family decarboxylase [Novosphingobium sp.]